MEVSEKLLDVDASTLVDLVKLCNTHGIKHCDLLSRATLIEHEAEFHGKCVHHVYRSAFLWLLAERYVISVAGELPF